MPRFEVFIPAAETTGFNVTFRVDADNWMAALKTGMQKLGEQGANVQNILVDIQDDNSVHVTESASGRVFRIRELSEAEAAQAQLKRGVPPPAAPLTAPLGAAAAAPVPSPAPKSATPGLGAPSRADEPSTLLDAPADLAARLRAGRTEEPAPTPPMRAEEPTAPGRPALEPPTRMIPGGTPAHSEPETLPHAGRVPPPQPPAPARAAAVEPTRPMPAAPVPVPPAKPANRPAPNAAAPAVAPPRRRHKDSEADAVVELEAPTKPVVGQIGRSVKKDQKEQIEDMLAEVFERVQEVYSRPNTEAALYFLLDLALEKIPAESGTIFNADSATGDLTFRAVRGPKAKELLDSKMVIPAGTGIVGFCAMEGVALALSDVQKDPRYYAGVARKVDYVPRSILCAPMMTHGHLYGCLQILNKRDNSTFNEFEVGLATYIAHQAAMYLNTR